MLLAKLTAFAPCAALALSGCTSPIEGPRPSTPAIAEQLHLPCLVRRGAYCVPDVGLVVSVRSSDEISTTILDISYRMGLSGRGHIIETGSCGDPSDNVSLIGRSSGFAFEGESWHAAEFQMNGSCRLRLLSKGSEHSPQGNSFEDMISNVRPCFDRTCPDGRGTLAAFLPPRR
jgi:hypothetical protein